MSTSKPVHCIVDDTPLTTNLDEIGPWVENGTIALVVPLYTLERLHILKKDASQIGQTARRAVKFLDQITSTADLAHDPVVIQGPDDRYEEWRNVEARYRDFIIRRNDTDAEIMEQREEAAASESKSPNMLHEKVVSDLSHSLEELKTSPISTPPLSPSASDPHSNKTSPEVQCAATTKREATPIPPALKSLINFVVWYSHESCNAENMDLVFLTNSADAAQIAKDFGVIPKTIHQLRAGVVVVDQPVKKETPKNKKKGNRPSSFKKDSEPRTLFSYDEVSSEDEELVFKPRPRDLPRPLSSGRGSGNIPMRGRGALHSPSSSINAANTSKPQVPVEEIDPDSFDRGTFARGSIPLANVGHSGGPGVARGAARNFSSPMPRGGGYRGNTIRGRGRGRLFVP